MKEISKLNDEINIKNKNLKILSNVNKRLKISLNNLTQKLDELIYKFTKDQKKLKLKNNIINDKEKSLEEKRKSVYESNCERNKIVEEDCQGTKKNNKFRERKKQNKNN